MGGEVFYSCILCRIPLSHRDGDDEYEVDEEDWRNISYIDLHVHSSCLTIAKTAATDRQEDLFAKIRSRPFSYDLFPLLTTIAHPASNPNQICKDHALIIVRKINRFWQVRLPEEVCGFVACELMYDQLEAHSPIPTLWHLYTGIQGQCNLSTVLRNVETLLAWKSSEFFGSRLNFLPKNIRLVQCDELRAWGASALLVRRIAAVTIYGLPKRITIHFNLALKQKYLSGFTVDGRSLGYKGVSDSDVTFEVTERSKGLLLLFNQWGFQERYLLDRSVADVVASFSCEQAAFTVLYWPEHWTKIFATFDVRT